MRYRDMEKGFQYAFSAALGAYRRGSTPIGCAILDAHDNCISTGENSIYATDDQEQVNHHHLAHAEINAILKVESGDVASSNVLYTTMEPCIMCLGAIIMCYYKQVKYAAPDPYGGAVSMGIQQRYAVRIEGPFEELQGLQVALMVYRMTKLNLLWADSMVGRYAGVCDIGVGLGKRLSQDAKFDVMIDGITAVSDEELFDYIFAQKI